MSAIFMALIGSFARLVDLTSVYQPPATMEPAAAMRADWQRVGDDFRTAIGASEHLITAGSPEVRELVEA
jgi:hypothetical protein